MPESETLPSTEIESVMAPRARVRLPLAAGLSCVVCIGVFVGIHMTGAAGTDSGLARWGYADAQAIWIRRQWWGLITSTFLHMDLVHMMFNVYWLWILGSVVERELGTVRWLLLFASAAFISSAAQLGFAGGTGIGASGVVYAFFGLMWIGRRSREAFRRLLDNRTIAIFMAWLVICAFLPFVGNAAHVAGLAFGALIGFASSTQRARRASALSGVGALVTASLVILIWCPWSWVWHGVKADQAYHLNDMNSAIRHYRAALRLGGDPHWGWTGLAAAYWTLGDIPKSEEAQRYATSSKSK